MSDEKQASLTVLGGPLGGNRIALPDEGEITIGSGEDCSFRLDTAGVSPLHARVVLEGSQATVFSTGAERPLHINDNPLGAESAALRNGDILWLGVPGEDDVAMLQCILAPPSAAASPPVPAVAEPTPDIETQALWVASGDAAPAETPSPPPEEAPSEEEPFLMEFEDPVQEQGIVAAEAEIVSDEELAPVDLEGSEDAVVVEEDELFTDATPTFIEAPEDLAPPAEEEVLTAVPLEAEPPTPVELPPTPVEPIPVPPTAEAPVPSPPPAEAPTPVPPAPAAETPARPAEPAPRRERPAPRRKPTPPRDEPQVEEAEARSPAVLALAGFVGVLLVAILGWAIWRFVLAKPSPAPSPTPVAAATAAPPPVSTTPPPGTTPTPEVPTPEPTATPMETAPPDATPTPTPAAVAQPTPTPRPTPTPTPPPVAAPAPVAPSQPSAAEVQAQQNAARVEELLGEADAAVAASRYDAAIGQLDEALGLDPGNSRATTTRARAVALRDLANRRFVGGRTRVQTEKAQGGGLAGFDSGDTDLRKAPDFQGRIEFEMSPPGGIAAGDAWTLRIFVINEGKKDIKIRGVDAVTQVNGAGGGGAVAPRTKEVPTQRRLLVGELSGTWVEGTNAWSTQVTVTANKGDSLRATVTWR